MAPVVIYRLGSLGDTVVALPCFHRIAQSFPNVERIVLTNYPVANNAPPLFEVLRGSGIIHKTIEYPLGLRSPRKVLRLRNKLKNTEAETLIYLAAPRGLPAVIRDLAFFRFCGFKRIIGTPTSRDLRSNIVDYATGEIEPEYSRLARTLAELGKIDLDNPASWDIHLSGEEKRKAQRLLQPFNGVPLLAINMGGKAIQKDWGAENWAALIVRLGQIFFNCGLVVMGASEDDVRASYVASLWPGSSLNLCGKLTPREASAVMQKAKLFIGHDSGPLHLAAAAGVKCIGIFGNYNKARKWHPWGKGNCVLQSSVGIDAIKVEQVFGVARCLLKNQS